MAGANETKNKAGKGPVKDSVSKMISTRKRGKSSEQTNEDKASKHAKLGSSSMIKKDKKDKLEKKGSTAKRKIIFKDNEESDDANNNASIPKAVRQTRSGVSAKVNAKNK